MWRKRNEKSIFSPNLMQNSTSMYVYDKRKWIKRACKSIKVQKTFTSIKSRSVIFSHLFFIFENKNYSTIEYDLLDRRVDYCIKYPFRISFFILFIGKIPYRYIFMKCSPSILLLFARITTKCICLISSLLPLANSQ